MNRSRACISALLANHLGETTEFLNKLQNNGVKQQPYFDKYVEYPQ